MPLLVCAPGAVVTLGGCQGDECMARKVGELVLYACQMEEAVLQIKRLLDDVRGWPGSSSRRRRTGWSGAI